MSLDPERRAALVAAKLRALVAGRWDLAPDVAPGPFPDGATLLDRAAGRAWVLVEADAHRRLGGAVAVAHRAGARELHLLVDQPDAPLGAGVVARRAAAFDPAPSVWRVEGASLAPVEPAPPAPDPAPAPGAELYRPVLRDAGLQPVVEGGELVGELRGLEVARVVVDGAGEAHVEAGVGRFDREASAMMFAELGETDSLARAVDIVARYRVAGAPRHPLNQLVPERWLRAALLARPDLVGAAELRPVGSAVPRANLTEDGVATAVGVDLDGAPLVVTCSTGVHLDLVPSAADDRTTHAPDARLVLAVPARDALPVVGELAHLLARPAEVVAVGDGWRSLAEGPG